MIPCRCGKITSVYERIYEIVRQIPPGKVATYGQVARIAGRCTARLVGYAMASLPRGTDVPWQRVINFKGEISPRKNGDGSIRQRKLLEKEGILFDSRGRLDFKKFGWLYGKSPIFGSRYAPVRHRYGSARHLSGCRHRVPRNHR